MCKILVIYETDTRAGVPGVVRAVARAASDAGAEVLLRPLDEAGLRDVHWADALALGIEGRGATLPRAAKRWLDALGFSGWRAFHGKSGCVFATATAEMANPGDTAAACRMVARILGARGMEAVTPAELEAAPPTRGAEGAALGHALAIRLARRQLPAALTAGERA